MKLLSEDSHVQVTIPRPKSGKYPEDERSLIIMNTHIKHKTTITLPEMYQVKAHKINNNSKISGIKFIIFWEEENLDNVCVK